MGRSKPWLKLWTEALDDPKLVRLPMSQRGFWPYILCLAQKLDRGGRLEDSAGHGLPMKEIYTQLFVQGATEKRDLRHFIDHMILQKCLHWDGDTLVVTNFARRQEIAPSDTREAARERQRLHRQHIARHDKTRDSETNHQQLASDSHGKPRDTLPNPTDVKDIDNVTPPLSPLPLRDNLASNRDPRHAASRQQGRDTNAISESTDLHKARVDRAKIARNARELSLTTPNGHEVPRDTEAKAIWEKALEELRTQVNQANFITWFEKTQGYVLNDGILTISAPSSFVAAYLTSTQLSLTERAVASVCGESKRVRFIVATEF